MDEPSDETLLDLVSVLYLSRFQHRFLIFRMGWLPALVPIIASGALLLFGDSHTWGWRSLWLVAAILSPYSIEIVSVVFLRQVKWMQVLDE
ncbi:MAG: hypothetical protein H7249_15925 [Chitinophagaceae bacterium]|nr:hypothetical protein [Oligoflexus sp.]